MFTNICFLEIVTQCSFKLNRHDCRNRLLLSLIDAEIHGFLNRDVVIGLNLCPDFSLNRRCCCGVFVKAAPHTTVAYRDKHSVHISHIHTTSIMLAPAPDHRCSSRWGSRRRLRRRWRWWFNRCKRITARVTNRVWKVLSYGGVGNRCFTPSQQLLRQPALYVLSGEGTELYAL